MFEDRERRRATRASRILAVFVRLLTVQVSRRLPVRQVLFFSFSPVVLTTLTSERQRGRSKRTKRKTNKKHFPPSESSPWETFVTFSLANMAVLVFVQEALCFGTCRGVGIFGNRATDKSCWLMNLLEPNCCRRYSSGPSCVRMRGWVILGSFSLLPSGRLHVHRREYLLPEKRNSPSAEVFLLLISLTSDRLLCIPPISLTRPIYVRGLIRVTQDSLPLIETLEKEKSSCTTLWLVPYLSSLRCPPCARCVSWTNFFNGLRSAHSGRNVRVLLPAKGIKILSCSRLLSVNGTFRS